jgi:hypothetical protein
MQGERNGTEAAEICLYAIEITSLLALDKNNGTERNSGNGIFVPLGRNGIESTDN